MKKSMIFRWGLQSMLLLLLLCGDRQAIAGEVPLLLTGFASNANSPRFERTYFAQNAKVSELAAILKDRTGLADLKQAKAAYSFSAHDALWLHKPGTTFQAYSSGAGAVVPMNVGGISNTAQQWSVPDISFAAVNTFENVAPGSTPDGKQFPEATNAVRVKTGGKEFYEYYQLDEESFWLLGWGDDFSESKKQQPIGLCPLPLEPGMTFYSCMDGKSTPPKGVLEAKKSNCIYMGVEGSGTLDTPEDGPVPALKIALVNKEETYHDGMLVNTTETRRYIWYTEKGHKLEVTLAEGAPALGNTKVQDIVYERLVPAKETAKRRVKVAAESKTKTDEPVKGRFSHLVAEQL